MLSGVGFPNLTFILKLITKELVVIALSKSLEIIELCSVIDFIYDFILIQNHRRYVRSRDDAQLRGDLSQSVSSDCKPYDKGENKQNKTEAIAPCGTIANSLFNGKCLFLSGERKREYGWV